MSGAGAEAPFRSLTVGADRLVVRADYEESVRALGLPGREATEALFAASAAEHGRGATASVPLPGRAERLHLRPVRHGGWLAPLWGTRVAGLARPVAELRATERLRARGAPVPQAVLVVGWRAAPLWQAVYGTLEIGSARDGLAFLAAAPSPDLLRAAATAAGYAVRRFHDAGGRHADLHLKNLLLRDTPEGPEVIVIDLDKARAGEPPDPSRRMRELMRLYRSLLKRGVFEQVGERDRDAFFAAYTRGEAAFADALLAHLPREQRRVRRHAMGYRS